MGLALVGAWKHFAPRMPAKTSHCPSRLVWNCLIAAFLFAGCVHYQGVERGTVTKEAKPAASENRSAPALAPDLSSNTPPGRVATLNSNLPSIFIAGDSTAARGSGEDQQGWAVPFANYFDPTKVNVINRARG